MRFIVYLIPVVSLDDTSPKGDGSIRKYFCGEETGDIIGVHLLRLGEAGFISGSKSRVRFKVAPQAITPNCIKKLFIRKNFDMNQWRNWALWLRAFNASLLLPIPEFTQIKIISSLRVLCG